ncbi:MAG: hypothetical protein HUN05_20825 [Desulfobacter sp.]|nr:MAG: hypothetical protein HUN05_20825 [Desulfobacter sp.]
MNQEFENITHAMAVLDSIQAEHIESFQTELMPDLEDQMGKRHQAFNQLSDQLNLFFARTEQYDEAQLRSMILTFSKQMNKLQNQNLMLKEKVELYRENLKARMKKMTKGHWFLPVPLFFFNQTPGD